MREAIQNTGLNEINNVVFLQRDLYNTTQAKAISKNFNTLILNPPRAGAMDVVHGGIQKAINLGNKKAGH